MAAFKYHHASLIESNIRLMFSRLKKVSTKTITHEEFLNLFVPAAHRETYRAMAILSETGAYRRLYYTWGGLKLSFQVNEMLGKQPPPIPRIVELQPDAPEELINDITLWSQSGGDASGDFGRVYTLFGKLNETLTKGQIRFVWPSIIAICGANHADAVMLSVASELQELRQSGAVPLPRGLLQACRKTAATISMTGLIPHDVEWRDTGECLIQARDGSDYSEPELGDFRGLT
jgi:hypothetical protein